MSKPVCAVVGIGPKNGAAFVRRFSSAGYRVAMLSRSVDFSLQLAAELEDARAFACDAGNPVSVEQAFAHVRAEVGDPSTLIYNAGSGAWKRFDATSVDDLEQAFRVNALGLLVSAQAVLPAMRKASVGNIIVIGATASLRGKPMTTSFAAAKAAQRSLAQSMGRQFWPEGIHVSLIIVDGAIGAPDGSTPAVEGEVKQLDPKDIAEAAYQLTRQPPSAWSFEIDLRPKNEPW